MKKLFFFLCFLGCTLTASAAVGETIVQNGVHYYVYTEGKAEVIAHPDGQTLYSGDITIPATVTHNEETYDVVQIANYAFQNCTELTSIQLPEGLLKINTCAFQGSGLTGVLTLPSTLTTIGENAFRSCTNITGELRIPASVTSASNYIFHGCTGIEKVSLLGTITTLGQYMFQGCTGITDISICEDWSTHIPYMMFSGCSSLQSLVIPDQVTSIASGAFEGCTSLASLVIGSSVSSTDRTFRGCTNLTTVEIRGNALTTLGVETFQNCKNLETLNIPHSVTSILLNCFQNCAKLKSVDISSTTSLGNNVFAGCTSLETVSFSPALTSLSQSAFQDCSALTMVSFPAGLTTINQAAFKGCTSLDNVVLPDGVTTLNKEVFSGCSNLRSVAFNANLQTIGELAFANTKALTAVTFTDGITTIGNSAFSGSGLTSLDLNNVTTIGSSAFQSCPFTTLTISDKVTKIGDKAFYTCPNLTDVTIGDGVQTIGSEAFRSCKLLVSLTLGNHVTSIGKSAFQDCEKLIGTDAGLVIPNSVQTISASAFYNCQSLVSLTLGSGVTNIGTHAFAGTGLTGTLVIPDNVTSIESRAFYPCRGITDVQLGNGVTEVGGEAFSGCSLTEPLYNEHIFVLMPQSWRPADQSTGTYDYTIPAGISKINGNAFKTCHNLGTVTIPGSVSTIAERAFSYCSGLTAVYFSDGLTTIGDYAFLNCSELASADLPSTVTTTGIGVFDGCSKLISPIIVNGVLVRMPNAWLALNCANGIYEVPSTVHTIAGSAFLNCTHLKKVIIHDNLTVQLDAFKGCTNIEESIHNSTTFVLMPSSYSGAYSIPEGITTILSYAFRDCNSLTGLTIPVSLEKINDYAFENCTAIESVHWNAKHCADFTNAGILPFTASKNSIRSFTFGEAVEHIPQYLCRDLEKITSIVIPDNVKSIGAQAIYSCGSLQSITVGENIETLGGSALGSNSSVTSLTWNVKTIDDNMFKYAVGCGALTSMIFGENVEHIPQDICLGKSTLQTVTIPKNVKTIANHAFMNCTGLKEVVWHANNYTGGNPFAINCPALETFIFGEALEHIPAICAGNTTLTTINIREGVKSMAAGAFSGCTNLKTVSLPSTLTAIEANTFSVCTSLKSIDIPAGVTTIEKNAFAWNDALFAVTLPKTIQSIHPDAFSNCTDLREIYWNASNYPDPASASAAPFAKVAAYVSLCVMGEDVEHIPAYLCKGMANMSSMTLSAKVKSIGTAAFDGCTGLQKVNYTGDIAGWCSIPFGSAAANPLYYAKHLFFNDTELTEAIIPEGVTTIGQYAFYNCENLQSVSISRDVTAIGTSAFYGCTALKDTYYMGDMASWCGIMFGNESANPIRYTQNLFIDNERVVDIIIPGSVTSIGSYAFYDLTGIETVAILDHDALPSTGTNTFTTSITGKALLEVRCALQTLANTTVPWSNFGNRKHSYNFWITVESNNPDYGTAEVLQQPDCNEHPGIIEATPATNCRFLGWDDGNTDNPRTLNNVTSDMTFTAIFAPYIRVTTDGNISELTWGDNNTDLSACDIVVADCATLTCDVDKTIKNITVEEGSMLIVPSGKTLTVTETLTAQSKDDEQPQILTEGTGAITYGDFQFVKQIPADRYYFFSLPFESETSTVTIDNGKGGQKSAAYNSDWNYLYYDGAGFAQKPSNDSYWMDSPEGTIKPNQGYAVGVDAATADTYRELVFKPTAGEIIDFSLNQAYSIAVAENPLRDDYVHPDKETFKGWNFIMNPYTSDFSAAVGSLSTPYVTIPDPGQSQTYTQKLFDAITLPPFFGFFVQVDAAGTIDFNPDNATNSTVKPFAAPSASRTTHNAPRYVGITLSNGEQEDETTLVIGEQYTTDYEIGSDLMKMIGYGNKPQVYTYHGSTKYAFKSINEATAAQVQPMGVYLPATGTYTFSLRDKHVAQAVYLYDYEANTCTNLVEMDYTFTSGRLNSEKRFAISAAFAPSQTTALPSADATAAFTVHQDGDLHITLQGVAAGDDIRIINVHGQVVMQWTAMDTTTEAELPQAGLYIIERTCAAGVEVNKIILQ